MVLDYPHRWEVHSTMPKHLEDVQKTFDECQAKIGDGFVVVKMRNRGKSQKTCAPSDLFKVNVECEKLQNEHREYFHCIVAKLLYVQKRLRPDIGPTIAFILKRQKATDLDDWHKLDHLVEYLKSDWDQPLFFSADENGDLTWYANAAFAVHADMRSHTGGGLTMSKGFIISVTTGQKLNTRSLP
jgi:hypothetical protein